MHNANRFEAIMFASGCLLAPFYRPLLLALGRLLVQFIKAVDSAVAQPAGSQFEPPWGGESSLHSRARSRQCPRIASSSNLACP